MHTIHTNRPWSLISFILLATCCSVQAQTRLALTQEPSLNLSSVPTKTASTTMTAKSPQLTAVGQAQIEAQLVVNDKRLSVAGQSSFHLQASNELLEKGMVNVEALNIALKEVPQALLSWSGQSEQIGGLGFVVKPGQALRYDAESATLKGTLSGLISADYMGQFAPPLPDAESDHTVAPRQPAKLSVSLQLERAFEQSKGDTPTQQKANLLIELKADENPKLSAYAVELYAKPVVVIDSIISFYFEAAKNLCVQPVRIAKWSWNWPYFSISYTGDGLAFGKPEAIKQWAKADVTFTWRPWKTVFKSQFFTFSTSEASDLLDEVNDSDCVEVYFVNGDNGMHNNWGGGATFWSGEAYTKIISSDANATNGIDKVHLAHELGHALDLPHPNSFNASSTNTLMCPSGFLNDNPARNSQENKNNLSNPLLTFSLKAKTSGPDCNNSSDCGYCP